MGVLENWLPSWPPSGDKNKIDHKTYILLCIIHTGLYYSMGMHAGKAQFTKDVTAIYVLIHNIIAETKLCDSILYIPNLIPTVS